MAFCVGSVVGVGVTAGWPVWLSYQEPVGAENCVTSCDLGVFVEEAAEPVSSDDRDVGVDGLGQCLEWAGLVQGPVWTMGVEVGLVLGEDRAQVAFVHDEDPVEEFAAYAAHPPFHDRVHPRGLRSGEHYADALSGEHLIEQRGELAVSGPDQKSEVAGAIAQVEHQVAGLLGGPCGRRVRCDSQHVDAARGVFDYGEAVQPGESDRLHAEEVAGQDPGRLGLEKLGPGQVTALRCWIEPGLLQNGPDGGRGDLPAQTGNLVCDAAISPGRVLGR